MAWALNVRKSFELSIYILTAKVFPVQVSSIHPCLRSPWWRKVWVMNDWWQRRLRLRPRLGPSSSILTFLLRQFGSSSRHYWVPPRVSANHSRRPSLHCEILTNQRAGFQPADGMPLTPADISKSFERKLKNEQIKSVFNLPWHWKNSQYSVSVYSLVSL